LAYVGLSFEADTAFSHLNVSIFLIVENQNVLCNWGRDIIHTFERWGKLRARKELDYICVKSLEDWEVFKAL